MLNTNEFITKEHKYKSGKVNKQRYYRAYCSECKIDRNVFILKCQYRAAPYCKSCSAKKRIKKHGNPMKGKSQDPTKFRNTYSNVKYEDFILNKRGKRLYRMECISCNVDRGYKIHNEATRCCIKCHAKKYTKKSPEQKKIYNSMKANINTRFKHRNLQKQDGIFRYLPYTIHDLMKHLESQFESWMSWDNHGLYSPHRKTWQIDHIKADSNFIYSGVTDQQFIDSWALSNLRPLEALENIIKSNK